jgi:hypothetical protein
MNKALNFTPYRLLEDNNVNDVDDNVTPDYLQTRIRIRRLLVHRLLVN